MNKVIVKLENCYGIKSLIQDFDFAHPRAYAIYAPNGCMKSSLANTFKDVADGKTSRDRIFPARPSTRLITNENGVEVPREVVHVIRPYDRRLRAHSDKTSTVLVNATLRAEYEDLHKGHQRSPPPGEAQFLTALKMQSQSKKDLEKEIISTFASSTTDDIFQHSCKYCGRIVRQWRYSVCRFGLR